MDTRIKYGTALVCDTGPHFGMTRVDVTASVYMTAEEYELYRKTGNLRITVEPVEAPQTS